MSGDAGFVSTLFYAKQQHSSTQQGMYVYMQSILMCVSSFHTLFYYAKQQHNCAQESRQHFSSHQAHYHSCAARPHQNHDSDCPAAADICWPQTTVEWPV